MADQPYGQSSQRPGSIRSVASNSSIASGVSLTRRARTRARSKTLTGGSSPRPDGLPQNPVSELAYLDKAYVQEPVQSLPLTPTEPLSAPPRPPRSPHRATSEAVAVQIGESGQPSLEDDLITANYTMEPERSPVVLKLPKLARQTSGLQIMPTAAQPQPPPSAFSRDPSLTRINTSAINVRDSLSTQVSGMSSSIYPPSTSTTSGPDSPLSPRSIVEPDDNYDVSSYDPEADETQEYDGDDVSYRLRLLVKNNYFLPPAHSKPSPADFASSGLNAPPKKPVRSATPTFMDLFRGKSKSKPSTPTGSAPGFDPTPALRTAADSITASFALRPQPRTSMQGTRPETRSGRVVVVREKMQDLVVAAKQAEHDMKSRGVRREPDPQPGQGVFNHVIDPTDAVDLPPPSSTYPFSVQASALHGLGVQDSVGAALLADRLPPPNSPGMTSSNDGEDSWRKALLQQAVHLSFDSMSPDASFSMIGTTSTPLASPRLHHSESAPRGRPRTASSIPKPLLEQRIMSHSRASDASPPLARSKSTRSQASSKGRTSGKLSPLDTSRPYSFLPLRAETPSGPLTPLTPPPRRYLFNPLHSFSQTELHRSETYSGHNVPPSGSGSPSVSLRKTMSSPRLSSVYASDVRHLLTTPPPLPTPTMSTRSSLREVISPSFDDLHDHDTESRYSDDVPYANDAPRMSIALSAVDGRPSLSDYSQPSPSPSTSTFRDALTSPGDYSSSSNQRSWRPSVDQDVLSVRDSPVPRYSTMSPPPRISSSMAHIGLSPAPRSSSFRYQALVSRPSTSTHVSEPERPSTPLTDDPTLIIVAPEPTTPPFPTFPINERRGNPAARQLSLDVPSTNISVPIHSAPGPSSPTSFFDSIQEQPNAMDDLDDSSSSESEGENDDSYQDLDERLPPPRRPFLDSRNRAMSSASAPPRSPMMRLGNHSTPYVSQAVDGHRPSLPFGVQDPMQPIGHIPARAAFFTDRSGKSDQGHGAPVSSFDFYKYTQQYPAATAPAPESSSQRQSNVGPVAAWRNDQKAQESLRKLDGMLIQHMETEKDTIKRIATTVRSNLPVDQRV